MIASGLMSGAKKMVKVDSYIDYRGFVAQFPQPQLQEVSGNAR